MISNGPEPSCVHVGMAEADTRSAPALHRALQLVAPALLIVYLLTAVMVGFTVAIDRIQLELMTVAHSPLPAIALAIPTWTAHRWRHATDAKRRHQLFQRVIAELVISAILLGSTIYQVVTVPHAYFTILYG